MAPGQRQTGNYLSFVVIFFLYKANSKRTCKCINSRLCVTLPLDENGVYSSINSQIPNAPCNLLVHLSDLDNGINPNIGALKK